MKFYRLSEQHPQYGLAGNVIPYPVWIKIPYADKGLYDQVDEYGRGYPYKLVLTPTGKTPSLYYLEMYADIVIFLGRLADRRGVRATEIPLIIPNMNTEIEFCLYNIKIIYRKEWQQDTPNSSLKDT